MRSKHGHCTSSKERNEEIDLALAVMCAIQRPGECVTLRAISEVTGMSHGGPYMIQECALRKIRNRLKFGRACALGREMVA